MSRFLLGVAPTEAASHARLAEPNNTFLHCQGLRLAVIGEEHQSPRPTAVTPSSVWRCWAPCCTAYSSWEHLGTALPWALLRLASSVPFGWLRPFAIAALQQPLQEANLLNEEPVAWPVGRPESPVLPEQAGDQGGPSAPCH